MKHIYVTPAPEMGAVYAAWRLLEEIREAEPEAIEKMVENRVGVEEGSALLDHPTVVLMEGPRGPLLGTLGVVNGLLGILSPGYRIAGEYDDDGKLLHFVVVPSPAPEPA
jgi:hypothetical protein